jgi:hypothetical protein
VPGVGRTWRRPSGITLAGGSGTGGGRGCLRGTALGSGRSSGAVGADVGVGLSAEVKASSRVGGQPREEHGWVRGGDGRLMVRSGWGGARASGAVRSGWARAR